MKTIMKECRWLIATLLLWLAAVPVAQAFYNPAQGRWLSRDPVQEAGGKNLSCFNGNRPPNGTDFLGLLEQTITRMWANPETEGAEAMTVPFFPRGCDYDIVRCGSVFRNCWKFTNVRCNADVLTTFRETATVEELQTIEPGFKYSIWDHELKHAENFKSHVENLEFLRRIDGTCKPKACIDAWRDYYGEFYSVSSLLLLRDDTTLHVEDYANVPNFRSAYEASVRILIGLVYDLDVAWNRQRSAAMAVRAACK